MKAYDTETCRDLLRARLAEIQSMREVAKELGTSHVTLHRWLSGETAEIREYNRMAITARYGGLYGEPTPGPCRRCRDLPDTVLDIARRIGRLRSSWQAAILERVLAYEEMA